MNVQLKLGDIITQIRGVSYKPTDVRAAGEPDAVALLRANNIQENGLNFDDLVWVDKNKVSAEQYLHMGDILICTSSGSKGLVGKAAIVTSNLPFAFGAFCKVVRTKVEYAAYLGQFFRSPRYRKEISASSAGANINNIRNEHIDEMLIAMPSETERVICVKKMEQLDCLIQKSNTQIHRLDELVKSRFVEMFGTYPANQMGWDIGTIRDVVADVRYGSSRPAVDGGKYPYLRMNNITYGGELDLADTKRIDVPENELDKCTVRRGDVLFNRTNSKELVGKTCVYNRDEMMVLAGFVIRVRVTERILPEFLSAFLNTDFSKQMLLGMCKAAIGQANINAQEMQNIGLYLPPVELQRQFVQFKGQVDKSKLAVKQSLEKLETLKKSLMQQYFG